MNRENIKKVRDVIASLPKERFDMRFLFARDGQDVYTAPGQPKSFLTKCGTAACIAGWTIATLKPRTANLDATDAEHLLGLETEDASELFLPQGFSNPGYYTRAHAVRVLDHLLETGEVDWVSTRRAKKAVAK